MENLRMLREDGWPIHFTKANSCRGDEDSSLFRALIGPKE